MWCVGYELIGLRWYPVARLLIRENAPAIEFVEDDPREVDGHDVDRPELSRGNFPHDFGDGDVSADGQGEMLEDLVEHIQAEENLPTVGRGIVCRGVLHTVAQVGGAYHVPIEAGEREPASVG